MAHKTNVHFIFPLCIKINVVLWLDKNEIIMQFLLDLMCCTIGVKLGAIWFTFIPLTLFGFWDYSTGACYYSELFQSVPDFTISL